jgi:cytochrome P450 PksS
MTPEQYAKAPKLPGLFKALSRGLLQIDPPDHTRLRALVHKSFTPRLVEKMRAETETLTNELLDRALAEKGTVDFIEAYALPIPVTIIGRILGVPAKDNPKFHRWTQAFVSVGSGGPGAVFAMSGLLQLMNYLKKVIQERMREPQDDLISALVQAREADDQLTEDEILSLAFIVISAGHETTVNLIASGTLALLQHRDQWDRLASDPTISRTGVEELLRFVTPAETATERYARQDIDIAGTTIPRGELVLGVIASANRDERRFDNGEALDLGRSDNKHMSFGQGIHYCVGAPLSRLEGQIAFQTLVARAPNLRLAVPADQLQWRSSLVLRGLKALPVRF